MPARMICRASSESRKPSSILREGGSRRRQARRTRAASSVVSPTMTQRYHVRFPALSRCASYFFLVGGRGGGFGTVGLGAGGFAALLTSGGGAGLGAGLADVP